MSTPPLVPSPSSPLSSLSQTEHDIQAQLIAQVQTFASHQVKVSYMFLGIIVLILALAGVGGWFGLKAYEGQVARAEAIEQKYEDAQKAFQVTLAQHDAERATDAKATAALLAQIAARAAKPPAPVVQAGLLPTATAKQASLALNALYSPSYPAFASTPIEGEKVAVTVTEAQEIASDKLVGDRSKADLTDTQALLGLSKTDNSLLTSDLNQCKANSAQADKTIAAYKAIAVKSKWQRFLAGALKVGIFAAGAAIGHGL